MYNTRSKAGGYKTRSALRVFSASSQPQQKATRDQGTQTYKRDYQPMAKKSKQTGAAGSCFEKHETAPTGRYFELGDGYYCYLGFYRNQIGLHLRVYIPDNDYQTGLKATREGCVIWGQKSIGYFLDLVPLIMSEFKRNNEALLRHPIEDTDLFVLIGREYGEIKVTVRRMIKNKSQDSEKSYTASSGGACLTQQMWQMLITWIPDIRSTVNELLEYAPVDEIEGSEAKDNDSRVDDSIVKWGVNTAVMSEIRSMLPQEVAESTDKKILLSEVVQIFKNLKLNDLVCSVYKRSRHLLHGHTVDTIENLVRNCYSDRGIITVVEMMLNSI